MITYCAVMAAVALILVVCLLRSINSKRSISWDVSWFLGFVVLGLIFEVVALVVNTPQANQIIYSIEHIDTTFIYYSLFMFVMHYCNYNWGGKTLKGVIFLVCSADALAMIANMFTGLAFTVDMRLIDGEPVCNAIISAGYDAVHLGLVALLALASMATLIIKLSHTSKLISGNYWLMLASLIVTVVWSGYIYSNNIFDFSTLVVAAYAALVYYYAVEHKPLALLDRMKSIIVSTVKDAVLFFDESSTCIYANNAAKFLFDIKSDKDMKFMREKILSVIGETVDSVESIQSKSYQSKYQVGNLEYIFDIEYHKLYDGHGMFIGSFVTLDDRTDEIKKLQLEHYRAAHDALTGLYNGRHFFELVDERLSICNPEEYVAIASDIRGFKLINDRYGHQVGDTVLKNLANAIEENCRISSRTLYSRLTADRFAVLVPKELVNKELLNKVLDDFEAVIGKEYSVVVHLGLYELNADDKEGSAVFDKSLIAISSIKNNLDRRIAYYSDNMRETLMWEQKVNESLDEAIRSGRIVPYLQAQVDGAGNIVGAEVLVRWKSEENGLIPPFKFIPVLEKNGTIAKVDLHMWESACQILRRWKNEGKDNMYLSVNISPRDFYVLDVVTELKNLVKKYDINPKNLRLEITETVMMDDANQKMDIIRQLRDAGFILEMDDFGSGYSSLNMLKDMPVDIIKLDMMFMSKTENIERTEIIVNLIVKLAYDLGLSVIAEGVETKDQYDDLMNMGCRSFQGYYFARPIPVSEFEERVS